MGANPPGWLEVATLKLPAYYPGLGRGEADAITLALEVGADLVLIDERRGANQARSLNLHVTGTLGVLELAAQRGLFDLRKGVEKLQATNFRCAANIFAAHLARYDQRR